MAYSKQRPGAVKLLFVLGNINSNTFFRDREIRVTREEKAVEVEERVEEVLRQGQKDLQETKTRHKKELAKVRVPLFSG